MIISAAVMKEFWKISSRKMVAEARFEYEELTAKVAALKPEDVLILKVTMSFLNYKYIQMSSMPIPIKLNLIIVPYLRYQLHQFQFLIIYGLQYLQLDTSNVASNASSGI